MVDKSDLQRRILEEEDFIRCPKCGNSLNKFMLKNSDGVDDATIARLLMIPEKEVEKVHAEAIKQLREKMVPDED